MLRDPVERAYSQYQMCVDSTGTAEQLQVRGQSAYCKMTFAEVVAQEIRTLQEGGVTPDAPYALFQQKVLQGLPMTHGGHSIVARGLYVLQLRQWMAEWPAEQVRVLTLSDIKGQRGDVQRTLEDVFDYLALPPHDIVDLDAKNTRKYEPMPEDCRRALQEFYAPYNAKLFELLGRTLVW